MIEVVRIVKVRVDDKDRRKRAWLRFKAMTDTMERRMYKEVLRHLKRIVRDAKKHIAAQLDTGKAIRKYDADDLLRGFDIETYRENMQQGMTPLWTSFAGQGAAMALADLGVESTWQLTQDPALLRYIREHALTVTGQTTATLYNRLRDNIARAIEQGVEQGLSSVDIAQSILDAVNHVEQLTERQAFTIARTEVARAVNWGQMQGAMNSGMNLRKIWVAQRDNVVRPSHAAADGQEAPVNGTFDVGGEQLQFPGDPNGSPGNVINCRCTVIFEPVRDTFEVPAPEHPHDFFCTR